MEYTFTLSYSLSVDDRDHEQLVERLGAGGCSDALVGIGRHGSIALEFTREADSSIDAVISALGDAKRAVPTASLIEAAPDLVGLTDVADMVGVSRQNMRKLMLNNFASFPVPIHEGSASIWHLTDVFAWLQSKQLYDLDESMIEVARITKQVNLAKRAAYLDPVMYREVRGLVA
jgi:predicted DNA-binding transcriptional regulator AlpA